MIKLNCGCGGNIKPKDEGWVNIDYYKGKGVDRIIDLEKENLDYDENSVDHVLLQDSLEHLSKQRQQRFLENVYKVLKPGGDVYIQLPHLKVLAQRYLGIIDNHINIEQFASFVYGGQDYLGNFHKWGYDEESLTKTLISVGFVVRFCHSDGGSNLLCGCEKSPTMIHLEIHGGLGDAAQTYLANPVHEMDFACGGNYPTSDAIFSLWFRRLIHLHELYPNIEFGIVNNCHNKVAGELFKYHPAISWIAEEIPDGSKLIQDVYFDLYNTFRIDEPIIYLSDEEKEIANKLIDKPYIAIHLDAGAKERAVYNNYSQLFTLVNKIINKGYYVYLFGNNKYIPFNNTRILDFSKKVSPRLSCFLVMNSKGFIGNHSAMCMVAWYNKVKSAILVPTVHDTGMKFSEFMQYEDNRTTWGFRQSFCKAWIIDHDNDISDEIVEWVC